MKQRLIDSNALHYRMGVNQDDKQIFYVTGEDIDAAPTIGLDNLRPYGHWEKIPGELHVVCCTNCGIVKPDFFVHDNYCPNCGAKMEDKSDGPTD